MQDHVRHGDRRQAQEEDAGSPLEGGALGEDDAQPSDEHDGGHGRACAPTEQTAERFRRPTAAEPTRLGEGLSDRVRAAEEEGEPEQGRQEQDADRAPCTLERVKGS